LQETKASSKIDELIVLGSEKQFSMELCFITFQTKESLEKVGLEIVLGLRIAPTYKHIYVI